MAMISRLFTRKRVMDELDWRHRTHQVAEWFNQPIGQSWITRELLQLEAELKMQRRAGQDCILHYGPISQASLFPLCDPNLIRLGPPELSGPAIYCDELAWPVLEQGASVVILHHALEFSRSPQELLKEAAHSLRAGGHLIIVGINPWSLLGMECLVSRSALGYAQCFSPASLKRVLDQQGFILEPRQILPYAGGNAAKILNMAPVQRGFYILVARKLVMGMTPCCRNRSVRFSGQLAPLAMRAMRKVLRMFVNIG